jgi:amino acid transporter
LFLALVQGWTTLSPFDAGNFVDAYILLPLFPIIYFAYKFIFKTRYHRVHEIDLDYGRRQDVDAAIEEEDSGEEYPTTVKQPFWRRLLANF